MGCSPAPTDAFRRIRRRRARLHWLTLRTTAASESILACLRPRALRRETRPISFRGLSIFELGRTLVTGADAEVTAENEPLANSSSDAVVNNSLWIQFGWSDQRAEERIDKI